MYKVRNQVRKLIKSMWSNKYLLVYTVNWFSQQSKISTQSKDFCTLANDSLISSNIWYKQNP